MIVPLVLAGVIWTYNICKIVEHANSGKNSKSSNPPEEKNAGNGDENITITNSAEAIKHIRNSRRVVQAGRIVGGQYGKRAYEPQGREAWDKKNN